MERDGILTKTEEYNNSIRTNTSDVCYAKTYSSKDELAYIEKDICFESDIAHSKTKTKIEYSEDELIETRTTYNYDRYEISLHNIRVSQIIHNSSNGYSKETNYCDYEMTKVKDITEYQTKNDGSKEIIYTIMNRSLNDDYSFKQVSTSDGCYTKTERFYAPKFKYLYSIEEVMKDDDGRTISWVMKKFSKDGELISVTTQEYNEDGDAIKTETEIFSTCKEALSYDESINFADKVAEDLKESISNEIVERHRKYVLKKVKEFSVMAYEALGQDEDLLLEVADKETGAQIIAEWTFHIALLCMLSKIPDKYFEPILQNVAGNLYNLIIQNFIDNITINTVVELSHQCVKQCCEKLFNLLKDNDKITEDCYNTAIDNLKNL